MGQMGFFDLSNRYTGLDAKNDPLAKIERKKATSSPPPGIRMRDGCSRPDAGTAAALQPMPTILKAWRFPNSATAARRPRG